MVENNLHKYHKSLDRFDVDALVRINRYHYESIDCKLATIQSYLDRFGHLIQHIEFDAKILAGYEIKIFKLIADRSLNALKSFKTRNTQLDAATVSKCHTIFANLIKLDMDRHLLYRQNVPLFIGHDSKPFDGIASFWPNLESFAIYVDDYSAIFGPSFRAMLDTFFQNNLHLTAISLTLSGRSLHYQWIGYRQSMDRLPC